MAQTRVDILREVRSGDAGGWQLCFQWCRYRFEDQPVQYGYRFVWRRGEDGSIQAARGQARIPSIRHATELMDDARGNGWGDRDGDQLENVAERLRQNGCLVELSSGYVGWPDKDAAQKGRLTDQMIQDAKLIEAWTH